MLTNAPRLFRIFGIDIRVHASWLIVFGLVTWSLAAGYFPDQVPGAEGLTAWVLGVAAALLFFGSVLAHELSHSLVAKSRGIGVHSITLFIFGGVSSLTGDAKSAATEFLVAVVGPLMSLLLAGVAYLLAAALEFRPGAAAIFGYLAVVNALVGAFNLIPGFPLDGGRVLRSVIWQLTGRIGLATRAAALVGQLIAYLFIFWGIFQVFTGHVFNGIWIAAIGWFLQSAASTSVRELVVEKALEGVRVRDVFRPGSIAVSPQEPVESVIQRVMLPYNLESVPVVDGRLLGVVTARQIQSVPRERRWWTPIGQVIGREAPATVAPGDPLRDAMELLAEGNRDQLPVVEDGQVVGILTRADVMRALELRQGLGSVA